MNCNLKPPYDSYGSEWVKPLTSNVDDLHWLKLIYMTVLQYCTWEILEGEFGESVVIHQNFTLKKYFI